MFAFRLTAGWSVWGRRSRCPSCRSVIAWYDLLPILSWVILRGKCRRCFASISYLYPVIEFVTGILFPVLFSGKYFWSSALFVSALLVATRTDIEAMVIPQVVTLWLVPVGLAFAYIGHLSISALESASGALSGYVLLWVVNALYLQLRGMQGIGEGDMDMLCFIGAFLGIPGVFQTLFIASLTGSLCGVVYMFYTGRSTATRIPFGPFLAVGAFVALLF